MNITKSSIRLYASPKAVITKYLHLPGANRVFNIVSRIKNLSEREVDTLFGKVMMDFASRHRDLTSVFTDHFEKINIIFQNDVSRFSEKKKWLLGAFFTKEYSIQAAALFNPSIVPHPDQQGLKNGEQRFIMSLRATGEGHISSVVFQTGIVDEANNILLDKPDKFFTRLKKNSDTTYDKDFIAKRAAFFPGFDFGLLNSLPPTFTIAQAAAVFSQSGFSAKPEIAGSINYLNTILDTNYELESSAHLPLDERVIFPSAKAECMGIEDVRFVKFEDGDNSCYYGTYTAYDGHHIKTQLIETKDFDVFKIRTLYGDAVSDKGMALFPEKVNGQYCMISRQGGEKISIMFSDDLYVWNEYQTLMEPLYEWEFVQLGNCGSPLKTEKGWLLLTHGVGAVRTYVICAILLDLKDPSIVIARLSKPFLQADEAEREGYVPNVVYTCGLLRHGNSLIIPYAVSDSATGFVTIELDEILDELLQK
ncbi:MAG: glycoside hydrolase family 130 protein [Bacteroidota bacterium]|nr:glycoside hydrolase family 130 protein [Bacteroidota bacterium]